MKAPRTHKLLAKPAALALTWTAAVALGLALPALPTPATAASTTAAAAPVAGGADLQAARSATDQRDYTRALQVYTALLEAQPGNADLLIEVARVNGFADRNKEAAALYRRVLQVAPERRRDVLLSLAWQTLWAGDAVAAVPLFQEAQGLGIEPVSALDGLGQSHLVLNEPERAQSVFRQALVLAPGDPALQARLARAQLWSDQALDAAATWRQLLAQRPDDRNSRWALAGALSSADRPREAVLEFQRAGAPLNDGERLDLARTWWWAGYPDRAAPLLAGQTGAEAARMRDWRVQRELAAYAYGSVEHAVDRDSLETVVWTVGGGLHPQPGATLDISHRQLSFSDANGAPRGTELQALYRWRVGEPSSARGTWWPAVGLRAAHVGGWSTAAPWLRTTWVPRDGWRFDADLQRERVDAPQAISNRVSVDVLSLGADHALNRRLTLTAAVAALRFDDGNRRWRLSARSEYLLAPRPRWSVGAEAMGFEASAPTGPLVAARGYWNPARYSEARVFTAWRWERGPWDAQARLALGRSSETDGFGNSSQGRPDGWRLDIGYDLAPQLRAQLSLSGSGSSLGSGGAGYWRRTAGFTVNGWF